ncbi:MAG: NAD-dependent epimerase/dehydratase [Rhodospirillales bacterium]|nr:NAD-dependent epimerase/dehydratase [Rhodospirillales bacterium]
MKTDKNSAVLITGGAGFIGCNLADRLSKTGRQVVIYDNLSRPGVKLNLAWLRRSHPALQFHKGDIRDFAELKRAIDGCGTVFHLAAQVAVTTSLVSPREDFQVNLEGTMNLLEAIRESKRDIGLVFTSTNKVYGALDDVAVDEELSRYSAAVPGFQLGVDESRPLDFHSPYGCSKGAADQYVLDYSRTFGLRTAVFRMSCIYGPHQHGNEDQGWVAHFLIRALADLPISIYGSGKQVRDILFVDDLVEAFCAAECKLGSIAGHAFNIGGGPNNTISLLELLDHIGLTGSRGSPVRFETWRQGDQRWYVSDPRKFSRATGWYPQVGVVDGLARLRSWLADNATPPHVAARELAG